MNIYEIWQKTQIEHVVLNCDHLKKRDGWSGGNNDVKGSMAMSGGLQSGVQHCRCRGIPFICHFFTQTKFLENKIYTEKRVNYDKLHSKLPILRVNYDKLHSKLPIFCVKSVKIYTRQFFFTQAPPVVPVTNMRYGYDRTPTDLSLTDLDRILAEEQDPGAHHYLVPGTMPIKEKNLGFWVPMHFLY